MDFFGVGGERPFSWMKMGEGQELFTKSDWGLYFFMEQE